MNKLYSTKNLILIFLLFSVFISIATYFYYFKINQIKNTIYLETSSYLNNAIKDEVAKKMDKSIALSLLLSENYKLKQSLLTNNNFELNFVKKIKNISISSNFKNIWLQIIDKNGISFYRSWTKKYGDYMLNARDDLKVMIQNPKIMTHVSTGKFDMTLKTMIPLYNKKQFIGVFELITHFNSITKNLYDKKISSVIVVNKKNSKKIKNPFTNIFINDNYVANLNAPKHLLDLIENKPSYFFPTKYEYKVIDDYLVTNYKINDINNNDMANALLFYNITDINFEKVESFKVQFLIFIVILVILFLIVLLLFFITRYTIHLKTLHDNLKIEKEKAMKASASKSLFLANMSHEIRTPLNAILGFLDILEEESKGRSALKYINIVHESSKNLMKIIEDILDFSKIDSGKLSIETSTIEVKKEFEVIIFLFSNKCSVKGISLQLDISDTIPKYIITDALRLKQVLLNLISNAIKFTINGKEIKVKITYKDGYLYVSVKDQGIGISQNKLEDIFEPFTQEDSSITRKYGGTGLGLSISYELVKLLGGELKVISTVDVGSEFYFKIPIEIAKSIEEDKKNNKDSEMNFADSKILIVEDNKSNQLFLKVIMKKINMTYDIANDGVEAIKLFEENTYDLILMDENMPNMNGIEATKRIREIEQSKNIKNIPIIALTANALVGDKKKFINAGMNEYLTKPVDKKILVNTLNKIISKDNENE